MPYKDKEVGDEHRRKRYRIYKQEGLCIRCGNPTSVKSRCTSCIEKEKAQYRQRYSNPINRYIGIMRCKQYDSEHKKEKGEYDRKKAEQRIKERKCPRCGVPLIEEELTYCFACNTKTRPIKGVLKYETAE